MIPAVAAPVAGVRYQMRVFWIHALRMLSPDSGIERVAFEYQEATGVDDVAVFYAPPGRQVGDALVRAEFFQCKFHVDHRKAVDHSYFIDPSRTGTKESMLARFARSWRKQREPYPGCRLQFLTNWSWDPNDPVRRLVRDSGLLGPEFLDAPEGTRIGAIREKWSRAAGLPPDEFRAFLQSLRFHAPWSNMEATQEALVDTCKAAGIRAPAHGQERLELDDLGLRLLGEGRTEWDGPSLRERLGREGLVVPPADRLVASSLVVRSFRDFTGVGQAPGGVDIELADLFRERLPAHEGVWPQEVPARLAQRLPDIAALASPVLLVLECHLSISWYLGTLLTTRAGLEFVLGQKGERGREAWTPDDPPAPDESAWRFALRKRPGGNDLAVVASITHDAAEDAKNAISDLGLGVGGILSARLPLLGRDAVKGGGHAKRLAEALASRIASTAAKTRPPRIHLFLAVPGSVAFLLGLRSRTLGPATVYEFDSMTGARSYAPAISTPVADAQRRGKAT